MSCIAPEVHQVTTLEVRNVSVDFSGKLDTGETLTGTPTAAVEESSSGIVINNVQKNASTVEINGSSVAANKAIQFRLDATGAAIDNIFHVTISCLTSASQTVNGRIRIHVCGPQP